MTHNGHRDGRDPSAPAPHVFSDAYYARLADMEERHWWSAGVRAIQQELLDRVASTNRVWKALDAGCGTGLTLTWLGRYKQIQVVGLDRAARGLQFCQSRGHGQLIQGDATVLPFASGSFDLALSCDVIQHLPRPNGDKDALAEMARVLAPGGYLLLRTNSRCGYPDDEPEPDYHRYKLAELSGKLEDAGLEPRRASYVNCLPGLALTLLRRVKHQQMGGHDPGLGIRPHPPAPIGRALYATLRAEAWLLGRTSISLPFGHSIIALAQKRA